jgi:hypothetical protein
MMDAWMLEFFIHQPTTNNHQLTTKYETVTIFT